MNRRQKLVQAQFLNDEEKVIKRLKQVYNQSMKDINGKVAVLDSSIAQLQKAYNGIGDDDIGDLARAILGSKKNFTPEEAKETLQSMIQSKVYQKKYQEGLQKQVGDVLDKMHQQQFLTVSDYLEQCYENGFVGTMFDLQGQGIPMCFPINQEQMVRAVQLDSKISKGLYTRLGEDISLLKRRITAEVSRGVSTGMSYQQVAKQLAGKTTIGYTNAIRIARTEGHRIQVQSTMDACYKAKDTGADVVKQWDSTLDARTRDSHAKLDGEIRKLDDVFSNGLRFPGDPHGAAAEVVNCRCALLQRAKWALGEGELQTLKDRAAYFGLDKADVFEDYKKAYLKAAEQVQWQEKFTPAKTVSEAEEFARKYLADSVDYAGFSVKRANEINQKLTDLYTKHPSVKRYATIDQKPLKGSVASANDTDLSFSKSKANLDQKNFFAIKAANEAEIRHLQEVIATGTEYGKPVSKFRIKVAQETIEKKLAYNKFERYNVGKTQGDVIAHEFGHTLAKQKTGEFIRSTPYEYLNAKNKMIFEAFEKAKANGDIYKLSKYASKDADEFFAECFCANDIGEQLPQYIIDMLRFVEE